MTLSISVIGAVFYDLYLECGAASWAEHHQRPEARPPTAASQSVDRDVFVVTPLFARDAINLSVRTSWFV